MFNNELKESNIYIPRIKFDISIIMFSLSIYPNTLTLERRSKE